MIDSIKWIVSMCFFSTSYVTTSYQDSVIRFFVSLLVGSVSLILINRIYGKSSRNSRFSKSSKLFE